MPATASHIEKPTAVDVFCGVGGLSLGISQAGFKLLGAVDHDQQALDTHKSNFPEVNTLKADLFTATGSDLRRGLKLGKTRIDLLTGGPPCQGFSSGGRRGESGKSDPRNQGIMAFARLVIGLNPRFFIMENVRGFLFQDHEKLRRKFRRELQQSGFQVSRFALLNAADYGVPQRRLRAFVIGCRKTEALPDFPAPLPGDPPTVADAIGDLAVVDLSSRDWECDDFVGALGLASVYAAPLQRARDGSQLTTVSGCLLTKHSTEVIERFRSTPEGEQEPVSRFFRLSWKGLSPTIRAGTGPEHGSHTAPRPIHPSLPRCITVREAARLHSFPDWFVFRGTRWHGFRQIGNSVPPLLAQAVAMSVKHAAGYAPVECGNV